MAKIRLYLDTRATGGDINEKAAPLKIAVCHRGSTSYINLNVSLTQSQWAADACKVVRHPQKQSLNAMIRQRVVQVEAAIIKVGETQPLKSLNATSLRDAIVAMLTSSGDADADSGNQKWTFLKVLDMFIENKTGRTRNIYIATRRRLSAWLGKGLENVRLEDVTARWLDAFDQFMLPTSPSLNARGIHMRNIRAVINYAIDNEYTDSYVFRRYKIKSQPTRKRNFKVDTLRSIFDCPNLEPWQRKYLDMFKLIFMLVGINVVDLCSLRELSGDRIEYVRAKTHKPYSIKVEPEALEIINRYRGSNYLLSYMDTNKNYRSFYMSACNGLHSIKDVLVAGGLNISELTSYYARHSWATIAASLDIPKETIAAALGHGGHTVTDIYIEFDSSKIDAANRRVLDWVLYGKQ